MWAVDGGEGAALGTCTQLPSEDSLRLQYADMLASAPKHDSWYLERAHSRGDIALVPMNAAFHSHVRHHHTYRPHSDGVSCAYHFVTRSYNHTYPAELTEAVRGHLQQAVQCVRMVYPVRVLWRTAQRGQDGLCVYEARFKPITVGFYPRNAVTSQ